ncbi:MAG: hypothetical protein ACRERS_03625, partial [Methylococcales bacterium]
DHNDENHAWFPPCGWLLDPNPLPADLSLNRATIRLKGNRKIGSIGLALVTIAILGQPPSPGLRAKQFDFSSTATDTPIQFQA